MDITENHKYPKESLLVMKLANTITQRMLEEMVTFQIQIRWSQSTGVTDERRVPAAQKVSITYQYNAGVKNACANYVFPVGTRNMGATQQSTDEISPGVGYDSGCPCSSMT